MSRRRTKGSSTIPMQSVNEFAGVYTTEYSPTGYYYSRNLFASCNDGWAEVCYDDVNPLFMRGKKSRNPFKNRDLYSPRFLALLKSRDTGCDFTHYRVDSWSGRKGYGIYRTSLGGQTYEYIGGFYPVWPAVMYAGGYTWDPIAIRTPEKPGTLFVESNWSGASEGPRLWNKTKPKLSTADLGVALGEIREALPMVKKTASFFRDAFLSLIGRKSFGYASMGKTLGDQWLNTQFGWKPFLSDLKDMCYTALNANAKLNKLYAGNDKWRRRRSKVESEILYTTGDLLNNGGRMSYTPNAVSVGRALGSGKSYISCCIKQDTWLTGAWKYFIPEFSSPDGGVETVLNYLRLYGIWVSPLLIWNLTPWSWLADWVGNIGDNIANYTAASQQNLVGRYTYIMRTTEAVFTNNSQVAVTDGTATGMRMMPLSWEMKYTLQTRRHASPFGFTLDWPDLSAYQVSILSALGLSRH
ncbi:maturation protein [ssRNA phage SRR6960799_33]|uniref:Maturation protein n=1 Tax=ssRNA phage SRR6960799_33 TaxID=2786591 RepID=A0A8S5KZD7_9VIRU|nr:maturation protein [ssRNA phage SRR6960799_33]DAD50664.1 TPA_asm: maturation protein [ssRNA phage SRR6960799_33]